MKMTSVFRFWAYLSLVLLLFVSGLLLFLATQYSNSNASAIIVNTLTMLFMAFVWIWLFFGELRTKAIVVQVEADQLMVSRYLGLGRTKTWPITIFDRIETCWVPNAYTAYEYLYLLKDGKKVVKISQFYHRNYAILKEQLIARLGQPESHPFSMREEVTDIFR